VRRLPLFQPTLIEEEFNLLHAPLSEERAGAQPIRALTGNGHADRVPRTAATDRALRAFARVGETIVVTTAIAARLEDASLTYVSALNCMNASERDAVRDGDLKLCDYVIKRWRQPAIDVDTLVAELGPDRVLAALDRLTKPAAGNGHGGNS
jgi:hypothetical protein